MLWKSFIRMVVMTESSYITSKKEITCAEYSMSRVQTSSIATLISRLIVSRQLMLNLEESSRKIATAHIFGQTGLATSEISVE